MRETKRGLDGLTLEQILRKIRLIVFDFDGVFTDNRVLVGEDGSEYVFCNRADGLGLANLRQRGINCIVLSTETNPVVAKRCSHPLGEDGLSPSRLLSQFHAALDRHWGI